MGYRKIEIGTVKTTERVRKGKVQTIQLFNKSQKRMIIQEVGKGVTRYDLRVSDVLMIYGVSSPVYYSWLRKDNLGTESHSINLVIRVKSRTDLLKLAHKLKEIEEIESVYV